MSPFKTFAPIFRAALVVALLTALALTLAYQARARVRIDVGGSYDAPFVTRFFDAENDGTQTYRWTRDTSRIALDAQALTTPWTLQMRLNGFRPNRPARLTVEMNGAPVDTLPVADGWDIYTLQGNGAADVWTGDNRFVLRADTFVPQREIEGSADTRKLGVVVDWLEWTPARSRSAIGTDAVWLDFGAPPVMPPWATVASWAAALALLYVTARVIGVAPKLANMGAAVSVILVALAFALARVWSGYFTAPFLTLAIALTILASLLAWLLPRFAARLALSLDARASTALCALILVSVALKWGGAWYPQFRSSDLLFHAHRLEFVTQGNLFFTSELPDAARRVVPYPPALYAALAPLTVFSQDFSALLLSFDALADGAAILAIYFAARKIIQSSNQKITDPDSQAAFALWAALLLAFNPVSFWIYSWGNHTNIFAQAAATILFAWLLTVPLTRPRNFLLALFFFLLAALGHLGVFLSLLVFFPLAIILRATTRADNARQVFLLGALCAAGIVLSWGLYYAEFTDILFTQAQKFLADLGAGRAAGRGGITLARAGDVARYTVEQLGWALLLLGLSGVPRAWKNFNARARAVWSAWLLTGVAFALLTLGAAFSTRYTLWAAPALALSGAWVLIWLTAQSRAGRFAAYGLGALTFAQTLWLWFDRVWNGYH